MSVISQVSDLDTSAIFRLDWEKHPVLSRYSKESNESFDWNIMSDLDAMYLGRSEELTWQQSNGVIRQLVDDLSGFFERQNISPKMRQVVSQALPDFLRLVAGELSQAKQRQVSFAGKHEEPESAPLDALRTQGIYITALPEDSIKTMSSLAERYSPEMAAERLKNPGTVAPIGIPKFDSLYRKATSCLRKVGIQRAVSAYLGHEVEPVYVALHHSVESEDWWKGCYDESNNSEYLHLDYDYDLIKTIIYLSPVSEKNGPFKYIQGSNAWTYSRGWLAFYKCFERALETQYAIRSPGDSYYRRRYRNPEFFKDLRELPSIFSGMSHFGDDLTLDSLEWNFVRDNEKSILSTSGNCFVFDGSQLIHRGGMVLSGERLAIQVAYRKKPVFSTEKVYRDARSFARAIVKGK
jgi:hypothetical protein